MSRRDPYKELPKELVEMLGEFLEVPAIRARWFTKGRYIAIETDNEYLDLDLTGEKELE